MKYEKLISEFEEKLAELLSYASNADKDGSYIAKRIANILLKSQLLWKGNRFQVNYLLDAVVSCDEYDYSDLRETDVVLDVGSCIGGFAIYAARKVKLVWAVEPLFDDIILENLILNNITNVNILPFAIGSRKGKMVLRYDPRTQIVDTVTFSDILEFIGEVDFLKLDIEMGEWLLESKDLERFRRVEIEVHNHTGTYNYKDYEKKVEEAGFRYYTTHIPDSVVYIIHGFK